MVKEVPEFDVSGEVGVVELVAAFTRLRRQNDLLVADFARENGMHSPDFHALAFMRNTPGATPRSLAEHLSHSLGATTATIDRLVASGYAVRTPNPDDGRSVRLALTPEGAAAVDRATERYAAAFAAAVPDKDRDEITSAFNQVADALAQLAAAVEEDFALGEDSALHAG
jgi:DNA-binding MarR family transcriptional regulator